MIRTATLILAAGIVARPALAAEARCYNSDDGTYACTFEQFGGDGSFSVAAPLKPTYTIEITGRDVAEGFADYGSGDRFLPGPFYRSPQDRACWVSEETDFTLCAY